MRHVRLLGLVLLASCSSGGGGGDGGGGPRGGWLVAHGGLIAQIGDNLTVQQRNSPTTRDLHSLVCVGHQLGWASGDGGTIIATRDGGAHWTVQTTPTLSALRGVSFADANNGVAAGDSGTLLRSSDGGATWAAVASPVNSSLRAIAFSSDRVHAWAAGDLGVLLRSNDGGASWSAVSGGTTAALRGIKFADDGLHGVAVGDAVLRSSDGGLTWTASAQPPQSLSGVSLNGGRAVAVGAAGMIWRSTDSGANWSRVVANAPNLKSIGFVSEMPDFGWAVGEGGTVLYTDDGGAHFTAIASGLSVDIESVEDL